MTDRGGFAKISRDLRKEVGCCEVCGCQENLQVHHKKPLRSGGGNERSNLIVVCKDCHRKKFSSDHKEAQKLGREESKEKEILISYSELMKIIISETEDGYPPILATQVLDLITQNLAELKRWKHKYTLGELNSIYSNKDHLYTTKIIRGSFNSGWCYFNE